MPGLDGTRRVLILGGTGEARRLAARLEQPVPGLPSLDIVSSLAGRTRAAATLRGRVRVGGFGGVAGLAAYLRAEAIDLVIDATHPFAVTISSHAIEACAANGTPRLVLARPAWQPQDGDKWVTATDAAEAAALLPRYGHRAFLSIGQTDLAAFAMVADCWFLVRLVDRPNGPLPLPQCLLVTGRGPFAADAERHLLETHGVDVLVCKASGGDATAAKLTAARDLGLPVVMIRRPPPAPGPTVSDVDGAVDALPGLLDARARRYDTLVP